MRDRGAFSTCTVVFAAAALAGTLLLPVASAAPIIRNTGSSMLPAPIVQPAQFATPAMASTGGTLPRDVEVADFDGDGRTDVAAANLGPDAFTGGVAVMLGDGAGQLGAAIRTPLGFQNGAADLAPADFDQDGILDIAALEGTTGGLGPIAILLGNGDGSFALHATLANTYQGQIAAGDVNQDGNPDLVFSARQSSLVRLYVGDGTGGFSAPVVYTTSYSSWQIELADLNVDGRLDLVGASAGSPWVMLGQPGGGLGGQLHRFLPQLMGIGFTLADFDGDGLLDIALVDASGGHVSVGLGMGDGMFEQHAQYSAISQQTSSVASGDFSGDGVVDLIANNGGNVSVLLQGNGDGTFGARTFWVTGTMGLTGANLDADARLDLVAYSEDPGVVYTTLGTPSGPLLAPRGELTSVGGSLTRGDVNGDGLEDFVVGGERLSNGSIVSVLVTHLGLGAGRFGPPIESAERDNEVMEGIAALQLADVNEDGHLDAVAGLDFLYPQSENILVAFGVGDGTFAAPLELSVGDIRARIVSLAVADMTGDRHLDIVGHANGQLSVLLGNGKGVFSAPVISGSTNDRQHATLVGDFTGDEVPDVVVGIETGTEDHGRGQIRVNQGVGNGTFFLTQTQYVDSNLGGGVAGDLNGDSALDVVVSGTSGFNTGRNGMFVLLGSPPLLGGPTYYPISCGSVDAADFNRDGALDIVSECVRLTIALNPGDGTFGTTTALPNARPGPLLAADMTQDGWPDILGLIYTNTSQFTVYVNTTPPPRLRPKPPRAGRR